MADAKVRMTEARLRKVAGVVFRPGLQRVSADEWAKVKKHPIGARLIERGVLEEVKAKGPGRPSADDLVAEIKETYDMERLKELAGDKRTTVSEAAQAQIDRINAQAGSSEG